MLSEQACGIDGVLYVSDHQTQTEYSLSFILKKYAPVLFSQAGLSSTESAFLASGVSGILNIVVTIITQIYTDHCMSPSVFRHISGF
jgi:hypothetical protein